MKRHTGGSARPPGEAPAHRVRKRHRQPGGRGTTWGEGPRRAPGRPAGPEGEERDDGWPGPRPVIRAQAHRHARPEAREQAGPGPAALAGAEPPELGLAGLTARRDALEQAAGLPGAQLGPLLDAAFAELDGAIDALTQQQARSAARREGAPSEPVRAERRMLRAVFQEAPVPLFLLERDATVRRVNNRASDIIGSRPAYAAGKPFTLFVDLPSRAAVQTFLAAAARTGRARQLECGLLGADGVADVRLTVEPISLPEDSGVLLVAASYDGAPAPRPAAPRPAPPRGPAREREPATVQAVQTQAVQTMARRMDLLTAVTRLLLENSTFSESLTLQRCARLLAGEFASWVIVDVVRGRRLLPAVRGRALRRGTGIGRPGRARYRPGARLTALAGPPDREVTAAGAFRRHRDARRRPWTACR